MNHNYTLLLAEDEEGTYFPLSKYLENKLVKVTHVKDRDGIAKHGGNFDALIIDVRLPKKFPEIPKRNSLDGIEAAEALIKNKKIQERTPIIFISILDETECQQALDNSSLLKNRYEWIKKPLEFDLLYEILLAKISHHR